MQDAACNKSVSCFSHESHAVSMSECGVDAPGKHVYRPAIGVVGRVDDELVIEADFRRGGNRVAVISLDDLLQTGMRKHSVADQDAEAAVIQKRLVDAGNSVDDAGEPNGVVRSAPGFAIQGEAGRDAAVDIGEFERFDVAVGPTGADEGAEIGCDLLLEIHAHATATLILPYRGDISRAAGNFSQLDRIFEAAHAAAAQK